MASVRARPCCAQIAPQGLSQSIPPPHARDSCSKQSFESIASCAEVLPMKLAPRDWGDRGRAASGEVSDGRMRGYTNGHAQQHDPDAEVHSPAQHSTAEHPHTLLPSDCKPWLQAACISRMQAKIRTWLGKAPTCTCCPASQAGNGCATSACMSSIPCMMGQIRGCVLAGW